MHRNRLIIAHIFVTERAGSAANTDRLPEHKPRKGAGGYRRIRRAIIDLIGDRRACHHKRRFLYGKGPRNVRCRSVIQAVAGLRGSDGAGICRNNVHGRADDGARSGRYRKDDRERGISRCAHIKIRIAVGLVGKRSKGNRLRLRRRIRVCHRGGNAEKHQAEADGCHKAGSAQKTRK